MTTAMIEAISAAIAQEDRMGKGLNITIVNTIERGFERTIVYSDGSTITQYWSNAMRMWVSIPE